MNKPLHLTHLTAVTCVAFVSLALSASALCYKTKPSSNNKLAACHESRDLPGCNGITKVTGSCNWFTVDIADTVCDCSDNSENCVDDEDEYAAPQNVQRTNYTGGTCAQDGTGCAGGTSSSTTITAKIKVAISC